MGDLISSLLFQPPPPTYLHPSRHFWLNTSTGSRIPAFYIERPNAQVTILFFSTNEIGDGPPLHTHEYDELFLIGSGRAYFTVGETSFIAEKGDVVFGPATIPHKFENLGPEPFQTTDIHLLHRSSQWNQSIHEAQPQCKLFEQHRSRSKYKLVH